MGTTQKYSLKWNDFTVNVASTFRDLHSRHDFVDVTLACADGSTLEAHKVILSSVSTYFKEILKTTSCKHPVIILKDTGRDECQAMLEFAYTGEVNVAQDLLPSLLHTARAFRIKGLDKVESPVQDPPSVPTPLPPMPSTLAPPATPHIPVAALPTAPTPNPPPAHSNSGAGSDWGSRPHTPSSLHNDVKPPFAPVHHRELATALASGALLNANGRRDRSEMSPPASLPNSRPPTREPSPCPAGNSIAAVAAAAAAAARTPPPKRWKRSFDMTNGPPLMQKPAKDGEQTQPLPMIAENYSSSHRNSDFESSKRFCEPSSNTRDSSSSNGSSNGSTGGQRPSLSYSQSMPTSPTMFERGGETRLAGLIRHHLATTAASSSATPSSSESPSAVPRSPPSAHGASSVVTSSSTHSSQQRPDSQQTQGARQSNGKEEPADYDPVDYRCFSSATKTEPQSESDFPHRNGSSASTERNGPDMDDDRSQSSGNNRRHSLVFRPESAPTVLDMSPNGSLSGPPSVRNMDLIANRSASGAHDDDEHEGMLHSDEYDCKTYGMTPDGLGRYSCDECGKIFKHPGSLQHHRHIHRGTHRCPSCGKAFSRRWDMERHLNKSKYGCPANRFSTGSAGSSGSSNGNAGSAPGTPASAASAAAVHAAVAAAAANATTHLELLSAASAASSVHNTTA